MACFKILKGRIAYGTVFLGRSDKVCRTVSCGLLEDLLQLFVIEGAVHGLEMNYVEVISLDCHESS